MFGNRLLFSRLVVSKLHFKLLQSVLKSLHTKQITYKEWGNPAKVLISAIQNY